MNHRAVIFDIGGVLMYDVWEHLYFDEEGSIASQYGIDRERLEEAGKKLWEEFAYLPAGENMTWQTIEQRYWMRFLELMENEISSTVEPGDLIELSQEFIRPVSHVGAAKLLDRLTAEHVTLGICSNNNEFWFYRQMEQSGFSKYFAPQHVVLSCRVGVPKNDPSNKMLSEALRVTGAAPRETLFIDDRKPALDRAASLGIQTFLFPAEDQAGYQELEKAV